ncbi:LysR family transcriptional regulator [Rhodobacteraceae bacterium 63075]|nr:LysR family transcriptional regulator [Rhodobacteraceae bacterium 63075]
MNLSRLQHFRLVAQERSFARAAELANITQPALSNSIRALEEELGFKLFERSERPIRLTALGREILPRVEAVLFEARNLDQELNSLGKGLSGHVRVGMTAVFSTSLGGAIIAAWHRDNPKVKLDLEVQETPRLIVGLEDESLDVIVGHEREVPRRRGDLEVIDLPPQRSGAFCREGHPILELAHPTPSDLARYPFAGTNFPSNVKHALAQLLGKDSEDATVSIDSNNISALIEAAERSDLILMTSEGAVRRGELRRIPAKLDIEGRWAIALRKGREAHPAVSDMVAKIMELSGDGTL